MTLQAQLEGTENRITVERRRFNDATLNYNKTRRRFPTMLLASIMGFGDKPYFKASEGPRSRRRSSSSQVSGEANRNVLQ